MEFDKDRDFDDDEDIYFTAGYQFDNHWALELTYSRFDVEANNIRFDSDFWSFSGVYRDQPKGEDSLFYKIGASRQYFQGSSRDTGGLAGLGYDFANKSRFSWQLGTDVFVGRGPSRFDFIPYIGLSYFFGKTSAPIAVAPIQPKDSDNDGVIDDNDNCPTTPPGRTVDSRGCELDSDNDGVKDALDQCPNTAAGLKVDNKGCHKVLKKDVSIKLDVKFENNSSVIAGNFHDEIKKVADFMKEYSNTSVVIEGHTDNKGAASYNQFLSQKRAEKVMNYLIQKLGINASRVSAIGKGEESPIADNATAAGRAINRRVQAEIKTSINVVQ